MIWVGWLLLTLALAYGSRPNERLGLLIIAGGLIFTALAKAVLHEVAYWPFTMLLWVVLGFIVSATKGRNSTSAGLCLLLSGVLKLPGRLSGIAYEFGNPWLLLSDIAGLAALLFLGWPVISDLLGRVSRLGLFGRLGNHGSTRDLGARQSAPRQVDDA